MLSREFIKRSVWAGATCALVLVAGTFVKTSRAYADDQDGEESKIRQGFAIAPVTLNLAGKNRALVGLGSYIVNGAGDCNGCHSSGPTHQFVFGNNPYWGQQAVVDPTTYLGGGRDFGPYVNLPHLYSRNLTPDTSGLPEGGRSFSDFVQIMRHGTDLDNLHPTCPGSPAAGSPYTCLNPPFDGSLLQIMPWPAFTNMTDRDLRAIYTYLSAIPCVVGTNLPASMQNVCP
jgi:hypothetical protein